MIKTRSISDGSMGSESNAGSAPNPFLPEGKVMIQYDMV